MGTKKKIKEIAMALAKKTGATDNPSEPDYYGTAQNWYQEIYEGTLCSRDRYRCLAIFLGGLLALSLVVLAMLFPLKQYFYRLIALNQTTGEVVQLKELDGTHFQESWVVTRYFISQYIQHKNTYHYEDIKRLFNVTLAMSSPAIAKSYIAEMVDTNSQSPINVLGKEGSQVTTVLSINQLNATTALVRFRVTTHPKEETDRLKIEDFQAVLKWDYENKKASLEERDLNPLGFRVTYYQVSPLFSGN